ncbi:MAG TPA: phosphoribosyl-AMP cyclohydrolase, partial [Nitrososphaerales archaeon]|nr:phosphoribosyl-AMP cyclohydrolase [Nitrososphaerales archaeon]
MTKLSINDIDFEKSQGLVPVIVQDIKSKDILMLAYANRLAVQETIKTGYGYYWSRSRD